jgi:hypothetical protein
MRQEGRKRRQNWLLPGADNDSTLSVESQPVSACGYRKWPRPLADLNVRGCKRNQPCQPKSEAVCTELGEGLRFVSLAEADAEQPIDHQGEGQQG